MSDKYLRRAEAKRIEELENKLGELSGWCENERIKLGAIDGYDYRSGEEYGLRRAQIQIEAALQPRKRK